MAPVHQIQLIYLPLDATKPPRKLSFFNNKQPACKGFALVGFIGKSPKGQFDIRGRQSPIILQCRGCRRDPRRDSIFFDYLNFFYFFFILKKNSSFSTSGNTSCQNVVLRSVLLRYSTRPNTSRFYTFLRVGEGGSVTPTSTSARHLDMCRHRATNFFHNYPRRRKPRFAEFGALCSRASGCGVRFTNLT